MKTTITKIQNKQNIIAYLLLFVLVVMAVFNASAQSEANAWYFGQNSGLNIKNYQANMTQSAIASTGNCATISTPDGAMQLYSDGKNVWNAKHAIVENADNLLGSTSASQGTIIIPQPGHTGIYYVFTTPYNGVNTLGQPDSLRFTIVNMNLNNSLGLVDDSNKNIAVFGQVEEKLTAINGVGNDVWIVAHGFKNNKYVAVKLTENGIGDIVESTIGEVDILGGRGCMKLSPNGNYIARSMSYQNKLELARFDVSTGLVSDAATFNNLPGCFGIEFSQNSKRLYTTTLGANQNYIQQYNINLATSQDIQASCYTITPPEGQYPTALQLGYSGIIYVANSNQHFLSTILAADTLGADINFNAEGVNVFGTVANGLPAFNQSYFNPIPIALSVNTDAVESLEVYPNPSNGVFRLAVGKNKSQDIKVDIYNMSGAKIYSANKFAEGQSVLTVDLSAKPAGVYFFDITTPAGKTVKRMVIN